MRAFLWFARHFSYILDTVTSNAAAFGMPAEHFIRNPITFNLHAA